LDLTAAGNALKIMFEDPITDQVIAKADCLEWFEQNANVKQSDFGSYIEVSSIYGDPEGVGARAENDYIPVAVDPKFLKQQIYLKYLYGTVQITKQTMQQMRSGRAAFIGWAESTLTKLERAIRQDLDRQIYGYGAGIIARVNESDPDGDVNLIVDSAYGVDGITNAAELFRVGAKYRFFGAAAATSEQNQSGAVTHVTVNDVNRSTQTLTLASVCGSDVANSAYIMRGDASGHTGQSSGTDREVMGLLGHIDDGDILGSYFGQARGSYGWLKAQVVAGSASPYNGNLTETLLMKANDDAIQFGGGDPDACMTTRGVLRNYFAQLRSDRTFNDPRNYTGGARDLQISLGDKVVTLRAGRQCPSGTLFMLDRSTLTRAHNTGWEWDDTTGAVFKQVTDGTGRKDEFYAYGRWFMQTFCKAPQQNVRIDGLSESVA